MRELTMLGTGNAMVTHCYNTCFFIRMENGEIFLTDAGGGNGILRQMEAAKADWTRIHHMFVTHGHTDHVLGVIWVIRKIASMINQGKYVGNFKIYCHDKVKDMLEIMTRLTLKKKDLEQVGSRILLQEMKDGESLGFEGVKLTAFDILSTKAKQFGYSLLFPDGKKFTCLGDEPYNEHAKPFAQNADWLLSEAFCLYEERDRFKPYEKNHSTVKEASELAEELGIRNLVLYHTEDKNISNRKELYTKESMQFYHGNVYVPDDLETLKF